MNSNKVTGLAAPTVDADVATKKYVDDNIAAGTGFSEADPQVDNLSPNMYCVANAGGTAIDCTATVSTSDTLDDLTCAGGQVAAWNNSSSVWE